MRDYWWFLLDMKGESPYILPVVPLLSHSCSNHLFAQFSSFMDKFTDQSRLLDGPGRITEEAFHRTSKLAGSLLLWFTGTSSSYLNRQVSRIKHVPSHKSFQVSEQVKHATPMEFYIDGFCSGSASKGKPFSSEVFKKISGILTRLLSREADRNQSLPVLSLASAFIPPFKNSSPELLGGNPDNKAVRVRTFFDQSQHDIEPRGCSICSCPDINWENHAIEPRTGIEFPIVLNSSTQEKKSNLSPEILVGTGSRTMKIIKIKSLKVYAFGFYVHPNSLCEKLGWKYASNQVCEVGKKHDFYQDLLREDIGMTVRLVINCNGMKINTVRDAFQKSLRARLLKTNPSTDYSCLEAFGSLFTKDIPLPAGTTVDFRRTADGHLITERNSLCVN
ncbi:unnamed protein product [Linum tenue]|uniref:Chalcone isomerase domain-containing protein n=1 Tax=Linum tenue TaxID=586396 RepID=A0AAV0IUY0_9ROSI|nr:unnamed protein product [Linum tenue]